MVDFLLQLPRFWRGTADFTIGQAILVSCFFLFTDSLMLFVSWLIRKETILECGYGKSASKRIRKAMRKGPLVEQVLLYRLAKDAPKHNPMVWVSLLLHFGNLICATSALIGFVGTLVTCGAGWAMVLLICSGVPYVLLCAVLTFIPDLIWVPSERNRYRIRSRKS